MSSRSTQYAARHGQRQRRRNDVASQPASKAPSLSTVKPLALNRLQPGVVVWAHIAFEDGTGEKTRPAVVVRAGSRDVVVRAVTSAVSRFRFPHLHIELADLTAAGVSRPCAVKTTEVEVDRIDVLHVVGELSDEDRAAVFASASDDPVTSAALVSSESDPLLVLAC